MPVNARPPPLHAQNGTWSDTQALAHESARIVAAVQAPLRALVTIRLHKDHLGAAQPVLMLHFANNGHNSSVQRFFSRSGVDAQRISDALDAVTLVYTHSSLLVSHSKLNADFWTQLLDSNVMLTEVSEGMKAWMSAEKDDTTYWSLRMVLDIGGGTKRGKLDKKWLDAIFKFMTDSPQQSEFHQRIQQQQKEKRVALQAKRFFGLSFTNARLTTNCLQLIQRLLESIGLGFNRHYGIDLLDLSCNTMNTEQLDIVTQILNRNHVYQIQDIRLDGITKNPLVRRESASVEDLLDAACEVIRTTTEWQSDICATIPTISLATDLLGAQHVISVCSALRYGCAFEEMSLASMINLVDPSERELCWRWLAFGIFYPRSKRFADNFKLRKVKLLNSDSTVTGVKAFASALHNPVAAFRRPGWSEEGGQTDAVLVGAVENGATVYSSADRYSKPLMTLTYQQELEILHSRYDDKWVCVVVAGVGLGWLQANHVVRVEHTVKNDENDADACLDLVASGPTTNGLIKMTPETHTFIETMGKRLRSLSMQDSRGFSIANLLYHCKNLEHLDLEGCDLGGRASSDLVDCLKGHLGHRLHSLNLNRTGFTDANMRHLIGHLENPTLLQKLKELRLYKVQMTNVGLDRLSAALIKNKTLSMLELERPGDNVDDAERRATCARIDETCQNQQLNVLPLPFVQRLAFVSAVLGPRSTIKAADALCDGVLESIFQFAREPERRKIIWTTAATIAAG